MSFKWKHYNVSSDRLPKRALQGGTDVGGQEIYVGRALHNGVMLPAKVIPASNSAYVCYDGLEIAVENVEVLTGKPKRFAWMPASDGNVAPGAISAGEYGCEHLFIGRAPYQGTMTVGKIHPSHRMLYIPFGGYEIGFTHYEVLLSTRREKKKKDRGKKKKRKGSSSSSSSSSSSD